MWDGSLLTAFSPGNSDLRLRFLRHMQISDLRLRFRSTYGFQIRNYPEAVLRSGDLPVPDGQGAPLTGDDPDERKGNEMGRSPLFKH